MIRPHHASLHFATVEMRTPTFQRIHSQTAASTGRLHVFIEEAVARYGLGVPNGDPAEIIENVERQLKRKPGN